MPSKQRVVPGCVLVLPVRETLRRTENRATVPAQSFAHAHMHMHMHMCDGTCIAGAQDRGACRTERVCSAYGEWSALRGVLRVVTLRAGRLASAQVALCKTQCASLANQQFAMQFLQHRARHEGRGVGVCHDHVHARVLRAPPPLRVRARPSNFSVANGSTWP